MRVGVHLAGRRNSAEHGVLDPAADLVRLAELSAAGHRLAGAIVGRALLSGRMSIKEAIVACEP